jgi:hypothetical protein
MSYIHLDLLLRLVAAHAVSDFILQPKKWVDDRHAQKIKSKYLYWHTLIIAVLSYIALGSWFPLWIPLVITLSHFALDLLKSYKGKDNTVWFIGDQIMHFLIILICWLIYTEQYTILYKNLIFQYYNPKTLLIFTGYIMVTIPTSIIITKLTSKWSSDANDKANDESLKDAGKWIGNIERILVITFTLTGKYEAIGFLLAAKSVFRFGDLREAKDRKRTEYIMIGTLLSFSISIIIGLLINQFVKTL